MSCNDCHERSGMVVCIAFGVRADPAAGYCWIAGGAFEQGHQMRSLALLIAIRYVNFPQE